MYSKTVKFIFVSVIILRKLFKAKQIKFKFFFNNFIHIRKILKNKLNKLKPKTMKTLTTTLSIFALLLSTTAFSAVSNEDITHNYNLEVKSSLNSDITPPLMPKKPDPVTNI